MTFYLFIDFTLCSSDERAARVCVSPFRVRNRAKHVEIAYTIENCFRRISVALRRDDFR